jgi:hypothetical protein
MKSIATLAAIAAISISAHATTGMPSEQETRTRPASESSGHPDTGQDSQLGSYARYLMLNGKTRERAIAEAHNIDHPALSHVAGHPTAPQAAVTDFPTYPFQY